MMSKYYQIYVAKCSVYSPVVRIVMYLYKVVSHVAILILYFTCLTRTCRLWYILS
jgi:hypothetical protein